MTDFGDSPYAVLEVSRAAKAEAIEDAYRRLTGLLADGALASYGMLDGADVGKLRHQLDRAYATLSDPARRAAFDRTGEVQEAGRGGYDGSLGAAPWAAGHSPTRGRQANAHEDQEQAAAAAAAATTHHARQAGQVALPSPAANSGGTRRGMRPITVPLLAEVAADACFDGSLLRALRESAQVSIEELSEWTKIGRRYLIAIENDDFALLPAKVYVRGFVGEIAKVLGFDAARVTRSYVARYSDWAATN